MGTYRFNYRQPNYSEYIKTLFDNTKDGILTISGWYFDDHDATDEFYRCHLTWDEAGRDKLIADFKSLYSKIEEIVSLGWKQKDDANKVKNLLNSDLYAVWYTYLRSFQANSDPKYNFMFEKDIEDYDADEKILMEEYFAVNREESKERLTDNEFSYNFICRAIRVSGLMRIKAPAVVLSNEAKAMLEGMLLYYFCTEKEDLTIDDLSLEELENGANECWIGSKLNADSAESLRFALKAVEKGSSKMYKLIARLYNYGVGESHPDYKKSAEYYELALEKQIFEKPELEKKQIYEDLYELYSHPNKANDIEKAAKYKELSALYKG